MGMIWDMQNCLRCFYYDKKLLKKQPYVSVLSRLLTVCFFIQIYQNLNVFSVVTEKHNFCFKLSNVLSNFVQFLAWVFVWVSMSKIASIQPKIIQKSSFKWIFGRILIPCFKGFLEILYHFEDVTCYLFTLMCA